MFYTRVPLELSQLVVTLNCISGKKKKAFSAFLTSFAIVFKCKNGGFQHACVSDTITSAIFRYIDSLYHTWTYNNTYVETD